jgi:hypothetical protein
MPMSLPALLNELEKTIPEFQLQNSTISASSVGWHIAHTLLTINRIIAAVEKSDPSEYQWKFNLTRSYVYTFNRIPRGKGKAPKVVQPEEGFTIESLKAHCEKATHQIEKLNHFAPNHFFVHPYFGKLNVKQTIKFLYIHTRHHLQIINDIKH